MFLKYKKIIDLIRSLYRGFRRYKGKILILTLLGFLSASFEGIGINALIPLFSFIVGQENLSNDIISRSIAKIFIYFNIDFSIKYILIFIAFLFILKAIIIFISEFIRIKITADYEERTRSYLFEKFIKANWPYLLKQKLGYIETVLMTNVQASSSVLSYISSFTIIITGLIIYLAVAINISFNITMITLFLSALIFFVFKPFFRRIRKVSYNQEYTNRQVAHHINENIVGMKTIKVMSVGGKVSKIGEDIFKTIKDIKIKVSTIALFTSSLMQPISLIFIITIFAFAFKTPGFNLASFMAVIYLVKQVFSYTEALHKKVLSFNGAVPYVKKVLDYEEATLNSEEGIGGIKKFDFKKFLEFKNVNFSYNNDKIVLLDINFKIAKGEMVGLIGSSGAGKTTIVDLILRLFQPTSGEILSDGENINSIDINDWRKKIGYVSQDIFLKNDTIADNIKFYDDFITTDRMEAAAKKANIYEFIMSLPQKFDTIIGERGIELSAGQRQRIVIARVLARDPEILILDEATSALDNESEVKIQKVIEGLKGRITVFVIAHRLSTVINCDRLLVLAKGKIIEEGRPADLLKNKDTYFYKVYNIRNK